MGVVSMASTSVSKTESEGSNPSTCANIYIPENYPHVKYVPHLNAVVKDANLAWWCYENRKTWIELYNSYYEYDNRVVKLIDFDGVNLSTEPLEGFNLDDFDRLIELDIETLMFMHYELIDIWSRQLRFTHPLIPENYSWYHFDFLAKNLMWSQGRLRLIDPDHFKIHDLSEEFSQRTKIFRSDSALKQIERAIVQVSQQLNDQG
tara:strand:+ start:802 stop:1416 length:615 start_codon:yes stop_codon:yes gene_type:complete